MSEEEPLSKVLGEFEFKLNIQTIAIELIVPNNWNPKDSIEENEVNNQQYLQIKKGMEKFGYLSPILVREIEGGKYEIIDGFHRWLASKELGKKEMVVNNLKVVSDEIAKALTILAETGVEFNNVKEAELLKSIYDLIPDYERMSELLPYTPEVIENKIQLIEHDWDQYNETGEEGQDDTQAPDSAFRFNIQDTDNIEMCHKALTLASNDKDEAFIELCRSFIAMGEIERN